MDLQKEEKAVEKNVLGFVRGIECSYFRKRDEYLGFITSEIFETNEVLVALDEARLFYKLYSVSKEEYANVETDNVSESDLSFTVEELKNKINGLRADISDVLIKLQKEHSESFDNDDNDDEYLRKLTEIRNRRKKFKAYDKLFNEYFEAIENVSDSANVSVAAYTQIAAENISVSQKTENLPEEPVRKKLKLSEKDFNNWMVTDGRVGLDKAKDHVYSIHSVEKLYEEMFGERINLFGEVAPEKAEMIIRSLIQNEEYADKNLKRHNELNLSLGLYLKYAGMDVGIMKERLRKKHTAHSSTANSDPAEIKILYPDNYSDGIQYKPCSITVKQKKNPANDWNEVYTQFLFMLYTCPDYHDILQAQSGKSLLGGNIDFADTSNMNRLRRKISIAPGFFAEGKLSVSDIIKRIVRLMELCSIGNDQVIIEYI